MNRITFLFVWLLGVTISHAQIAPCELIPKPLHCIEKPGVFEIHPAIKIYAPPKFADVALLLSEQLNLGNNALTQSHSAQIVFQVTSDMQNPEAYRLTIEPTRVVISASDKRGALHAVFTLVQLQLLQPDLTKLPCAEIADAPRFAYRGMHLDVSRNFFPVSFIKLYIDLMALYKYNTFHWHLTDGPGWRLEIMKYPELTSKAAFRTHKTWKEWWNSGRKYSNEGDPMAYSGYYTQNDAREIVIH